MSENLKRQLIKLGSTNPALRTHLRPVLAALDKVTSAPPSHLRELAYDLLVTRPCEKAPSGFAIFVRCRCVPPSTNASA